MTARAPGPGPRVRGTGPLSVPTLVLLASTAVMTLGVVVPVPLLQVIVTLPIALLAPGYALIGAAFGSRARLDVVPALALSALLSMGSYMLLGLGLYAASIRLSTESVLAGTDGIILLLVAVALLRARLGLPVATWPAASFDAVASTRSPWHRVQGGMLFGSGLAIVAAALFVTMYLLPKSVDPPYTQLYLAGPSSHISSIVQTQPHYKLVVEVGVTNHTHRQHTYRITPLLDDVTRWHERTVTLPVGRTWTGSVSGYVPAGGCVHRLSIALNTPESRGVPARLILWVRGARGLPASCRGGQGR
jgi:uncharacterized membrane protein